MVDMKKYKQYQVIKSKKGIEMNNLLQQYQHIPKLSKTKQLINPYQSNTSATTQSQLSRIFLLNNRNKVSLSESQSDEQKQVDHSKSIIPTFSRLLTFDKNYIQNSEKIDQIYEPQQEDNKQDSIDNQSLQNSKQLANTDKMNMNSNYSFPCTSFPSHSIQSYYNKGNQNSAYKQNYTEPQEKQIDYNESYQQTYDCQAYSTKNANNSKYNVPFKQSMGKQDPLPIKSNHKYTSSFGHPYPNYQVAQPKPIVSTRLNHNFDDNPSSEQEIADEQVTEQITNSKCSYNLSMNNKSLHSVKPSLHSASRIQQMHSGHISSRRGSIIDQIKQHHFAQSNVYDRSSDVKGIVDSPKCKAKTVEDQALIDEGTQTKKIKRRTKIFYQPKYKIDKKQKNIQNNEELMKPKQFSKGFSTEKKESVPNEVYNKQQPTVKKIIEIHECAYKQACKQSQCHLKLLNIVDKLTDKPVHQNSTKSKKEQMLMIQRNIQSQFLFLSLQVDQLSIQLTLHKILDSDLSGKVVALKIKIQRLLDKIKNAFELNNMLSGDKSVIENENRWQLFDKLQKMCQTLHYIQIVQQRYKLWRSKLKYLKEQIRDIIKVSKQKQLNKIGEIIRMMKQLQSSKFYGNQSHIFGLVKSYNIFIDGQVQQLNQTVECLKNDILSS